MAAPPFLQVGPASERTLAHVPAAPACQSGISPSGLGKHRWAGAALGGGPGGYNQETKPKGQTQALKVQPRVTSNRGWLAHCSTPPGGVGEMFKSQEPQQEGGVALAGPLSFTSLGALPSLPTQFCIPVLERSGVAGRV